MTQMGLIMLRADAPEGGEYRDHLELKSLQDSARVGCHVGEVSSARAAPGG